MRRTCFGLLLLMVCAAPGCVGAAAGSYFATQTPIPVQWLASNPAPTVGNNTKIGQPQSGTGTSAERPPAKPVDSQAAGQTSAAQSPAGASPAAASAAGASSNDPAR
ncbi:MAG TPA: hypothetical protein VGG30_00970 [Pirellulales bacterium]